MHQIMLMVRKNAEEVKDVLDQKVEEITSLCTANKVPFAVIYSVETEHGTDTSYSILTPAKVGIKLTEDRISPLVVIIGTKKFKVVPVKEEEIFDEETYYPDYSEEDKE